MTCGRQATQANSCNESARAVLQTSIAGRGVELDSGDPSHPVCLDRLWLVPCQFHGQFLAFSVRSLSTTYDEYHGRERIVEVLKHPHLLKDGTQTVLLCPSPSAELQHCILSCL